MIKTKQGVYPCRNGKLAQVNVEIIGIHDLFQEDKIKLIVADFIIQDDVKQYLGDKPILLSYQQRDGLKQVIVSQLPTEMLEGKSESEINKMILPYALLYFIQNDIVDNETGFLIYGTKAEDWEVTPVIIEENNEVIE